MDLAAYRLSPTELERTESLLRMIVPGRSVLEIGARDGHFSKILPNHFDEVTALDLSKPAFLHPRVTPVAGDVRALQFEDRAFDCVFCTEVLEHIDALEQAASEIARVAKTHLLIGVPFKQDLRWGRLTCRHCLHGNPAWGHLNSFDEARLGRLFPQFAIRTAEYVSSNRERTNPVSSLLMELGRNPWGRYNDEDRCRNCGAVLDSPPQRNMSHKICSKLAAVLNQAQSPFVKPWPFWIHLSMERVR